MTITTPTTPEVAINVQGEVLPNVPVAQHHLHTPEDHAVDELPSSAAGAAAADAPHAEPKPTTRTVLIPVERSVSSTATLHWARRNVLRPTDKVILVNVRPFQQIYFADLGAELLISLNDLEKAVRQESHDLVRMYAKYLQSEDQADEHLAVPAQVQGFALRGDARSSIVAKAQEMGADLIVMGSHSKGIFERMTLGSVSEYVSQHASVPVVIVRPDGGHVEKAEKVHARIYPKLKPGMSVTSPAIVARQNYQ